MPFKVRFYLFVFSLFSASFAIAASANAADAVIGVNIVNPYKLSIPEQDSMLGEMKSSGVNVIRASITQDAKGVDFAQRAWKHGIRIEWLIYHFGGYDPFGKQPLSAADPEIFTKSFTPILTELERRGITLAAFELGNEINLSGTNPEFPIPGKGVQLSLEQLNNDPEGRQIGKGYIQYLKILAALKDIRDNSALNRHTPILTAGLGNYERDDGPLPKGTSKGDIVSINTTLDYMRAHGLDNLVDGYAVHIYPWSNSPGDSAAALGRKARLARYGLTQCRAAGSHDGKPCWITEWGFNNTDMACPINDTSRTLLVREMMDDFRTYTRQGSVAGLLYFSWNGDPSAKTASVGSVWRCGSLTDSGKASIDGSLLK